MMDHNVIGLDIGGTKIFAVRYDLNLKVEKEIRIPTQADKGQKQVLENMTQALQTVQNEKTHAIGIGWAGFVNPKTGFIHKAPNIHGFENFPLGEALRKKFSIPIKIENDARVFALAEQKINSPDMLNFLGIIVGTGVGSGLILDGRIVDGQTHFAGEIGHMILDKTSQKEAEEIFSGQGLSELFEKHMGEKSMRAVEKMMKTRKKEIEIIMMPVIDAMALWIYNLLLAYNPGKIVFGGGIGSHFLPYFEKPLIQKVQEYIDRESYPISFELGFSTLKNAGSLGAGLLAWDMIK